MFLLLLSTFLRTQGLEHIHATQNRAGIHAPPVFDLEHLQNSTGMSSDDSGKGNLQLSCIACRSGTGKLLVRFEIFNADNKPKLVPPLSPFLYVLEFKDGNGKPTKEYDLPLIEPAALVESALSTVYPQNIIRADYVLRTFYTRHNKVSPRYCRVTIDVPITRNGELTGQRFWGASPWCEIPQR